MRHRIAFIIRAVAVAAAFAVSTSASVSITSCNPTFTASTSGTTYIVTAPLTAASGANCIDVTGRGITIQLNGMTLTGKGSGGIGIAISAKAVGTYVESGTVQKFAIGIQDLGDSARIESVELTANTTDGVELSGVDGSIVAGSNITGNGQNGVELVNARNCLVQHNPQISMNGQLGVWIHDTATPKLPSDNVVAVNELNGNGTAGVEVGNGNCFSTSDSEGNLIAGNGLPLQNGNYGIILDCHTGTGSEVLGNVLGPGVGSIDDLFDATYDPSCDSNTWVGNTFTKANQTCIH